MSLVDHKAMEYSALGHRMALDDAGHLCLECGASPPSPRLEQICPGAMPPDEPQTEADKEAKARHMLWEKLGFPVSPTAMEQSQYEREYKGRTWCHTESIMRQLMSAWRVMFCPKCMQKEAHGISATRLYITIEDDIMTVFKAMGHAACHHCGFEEYYPCMRDPRGNMAQQAGLASREDQLDALKYAALRQRGLQGPVPPPPPNAIGGGIGMGVAPMSGGVLGLNPGSLGMALTQDEYLSMQKIYQNVQQRKVAPPINKSSVIQSREDAIRMLAAAPANKRAEIMEKLIKDGAL